MPRSSDDSSSAPSMARRPAGPRGLAHRLRRAGRPMSTTFPDREGSEEDLKDLSGLEVGDKVSAGYDEYPNMSKQLTQIKLLKKKPAEPAEAEEM